VAKYKVRFVNPQEHYRRLKSEIEPAILNCLEKGDLIARQQLADFEKHFAEFIGAKFCVGVNSGYHALALSLLAAGLGPGDEVITVAHTFVATISAIVHCGATPVLADVDKDFNMDLRSFERAITPRTRAVLPVHLNGRVCNMDELMRVTDKHKLLIIEDAAQSIGCKFKGRMAGSFGKAGCFSFYPFKMLGCFGDGGAVTTDDPELALAVTRLRYNGEDRYTREYHHHGFTALLDNIQAAALDVKLRHLPTWIEHRRRLAARYRKELSGVGDLTLPHFSGKEHYDGYQNYVIRTADRDALVNYLEKNGIETIVSWPKPVWEHRALKLGRPDLPETEKICREVVSLPMYPELSEEDVRYVAKAVRNFFGKSHGSSTKQAVGMRVAVGNSQHEHRVRKNRRA
jgi:dTDP-4-amino-4,6-dideoxygalactose transaminase